MNIKNTVIDNCFINAQKVAYQGLLNDIESHDYTTISEIKGAIQIELDCLTKLEFRQSNQYEADAKADHFSGEQFLNV